MTQSFRPEHNPPKRLTDSHTLGLVWTAGREADLGMIEVHGITHDSRSVRPGDIYVALSGSNVHGGQFARAAAKDGAVAVLTDPAGSDFVGETGLPVAIVDDPRAVLGDLSAWVYGAPADDLLLIGVTGTNGKTTMSYFIEGGLSAAGHVTGLIGTTGIFIDDASLPSARTTPEAPDVQGLLALMRERRVSAVVMEVSSHALVLGRVGGLVFDVAVFTNLSQDHLDFHGTMEDYYAAKASLFEPRRCRSAVICVDDAWGDRLANDVQLPVRTYGIGQPPEVAESGEDMSTPDAAGRRSRRDWTAWRVEPTVGQHTAISVIGPDEESLRLLSPLPGKFNAANALGAYLALLAAGVDAEHARQGLLLSRSVPGRLERIGGPHAPRTVFVDYAHSPDAVQRVISAARQISAGRLIVVLGCGGDRDQAKRPLMGEISARMADELIVTDDNPRSEDPAAIREAMLAGVPWQFADRVRQIGDRGVAIRTAVSDCQPGDVALILGKGHEQGQEVAGVVHPVRRPPRGSSLAGLTSGGGMP